MKSSLIIAEEKVSVDFLKPQFVIIISFCRDRRIAGILISKIFNEY